MKERGLVEKGGVRVPGEVCGGASALPSSAVSPVWRCPALSGVPAGEGENSATWKTTSLPQGSPSCPCWAWWGQNTAVTLCPCYVQRHLPGTRTCDSGPSNKRTAAGEREYRYVKSQAVRWQRVHVFVIDIYLVVWGENELEDNHQSN